MSATGPPDLSGDLAHEPRALRVILVRAVREIQANGVDAGVDERAQLLRRIRRRPERGDDLGSTIRRPPC